MRARGLRKVLGGVGLLGVEPGPTAATGGRRAVERPLGLPTSVCVVTSMLGLASMLEVLPLTRRVSRSRLLKGGGYGEYDTLSHSRTEVRRPPAARD